MLALLEESPGLLIAAAGLLGLVVGSFLNVVVLRLPAMMEREWQRHCEAWLEERKAQAQGGRHAAASPSAAGPEPERFDLIHPPSHCPRCERRIRPLENIPLLGWLWLRGRCAGCRQPISVRYPLVEAVTAAASMTVAWHYGAGWEMAAALGLTWTLIALSLIDADHQLLPDSLTLPLLWAGLLLGQLGLFAGPADAVFGAAAGYLSLWSVYWLFRLATGRDGMGYGDFKLLAALGAWTGWTMLLPIILLSSVIGALVGTALIALAGRDRARPIPFGPYLAAAGWVTLLWGEPLVARYLGAFAAV